MRTPKNRRQHLIAKLIAERTIISQPQLVDLLSESGVVATQATVSRDLLDLGAVKVRVPGTERAVYAIAELPRDQVAPTEHLRRVLGEWVVETSHSANLVVLRTPPGCAHVVASAIDRTGVDGVIGTVAGDDTVLVVAGTALSGAELAERIEVLAGR